MARGFGRKDVGAWLGGNRGTVQSRMPSVGASSDTEAKADVGGGQMEQVRAELGLGAYAFGVGAAGAIGAGVAAVKSGAAARAVNAATGRKIVVHGSPVSGLKTIEPRVGSNQLPEANVMFGWDPSKKGMQGQITRQAGRYTSKNQGTQVGSVYVTSIKKSEIVTPDKLLNTGQVVSRGSGKVLKEIPASGQSFRDIDAELQRQLRRFGAPAKPQVSRVASAVSKTKTKVSELALTKAQKQDLRNRRIR